MDVERRAEVLVRHRRALQVPAGTARPPRGRPGRLARLGRLPQREVARVALGVATSSRRPAASRRGAGRTARRTAATTGRRSRRRRRPRRRGRASISRCISSIISGTWPVARGSTVRRQAAERRRRPQVNARSLRWRAARTGCPRRPRLGDDLVVDVGDVADERDVVAAVGEPAAQDVEDDAGADVPDVRRGLHGGAAQVDRAPCRDAAGRSRGPQRAAVSCRRRSRAAIVHRRARSRG